MYRDPDLMPTWRIPAPLAFGARIRGRALVCTLAALLALPATADDALATPPDVPPAATPTVDVGEPAPVAAAETPLPPALAELWRQWNDPDTQAVEPFWIFDDLAYVGMEWVAAYVLVTDAGLIVIDTLYGPWAEHLVRGIETLGLDPADIRYVIVTHGHFDHAGGAAQLQRRAAAVVAMSREDWSLAAQPADRPQFAFDLPEQGPGRSRVLGDGDTITLGSTTVHAMLTPGHTPGVLTLRYTVHDGAEALTAVTLGGVGLNFSGVEATQAYIHSYERLRATAQDVAVSLPNHASMGDVFERGKRLAERAPGEPHPFVDGPAYRASLTEFLHAARAKLRRERAGVSDDPVATLRATIDH